MFLSENSDQSDILRRFADTRHKFGMVRIESGVLLYLIKAHRFWEGRAESFNKFLADNQLSANGANQFIKVAHKFYFELGVRDERLSTLAKCSMSTLLMAVDKVNRHNLDEMLVKLEMLSKEDIRIELEAMGKREERIFNGVEVSENMKHARQLISTLSPEEILTLRNELFNKTRS
ncbi:MAG: hypothetical protein ACTS9Y_01010 [Methylophilus sp.]|uniref:hypothetical protein n=1 Tax=Methylophilus sp. TaxID=29541 RepID=UPI003F9EF71F